MSKFQIILTALFVFFIILGVVLFATYKSSNSGTTLPTVTIWGSFPEATINELVQQLNLNRSVALSINYFEIPQSEFRQKFIEELASGRGPDAILIPQQDMLGFKDKVIEVPNTIFTQRDFQNTFVPQADLYITQTGTLAIPFTIDPIVMYWNRTIFTNAGLAKYPIYWDEFGPMGSKITLKDDKSNIRRSIAALGEFNNINHAREILSTLLLQAGNPITYYSDGEIQSALGDSNYSGIQSSSQALLFFTKFSNPRDPQYSWNRSLPSSKNSFLSGNLATYFGLASEISELRQKNANIDFDIAPIPQDRKGKVRTTYGNMYGISIVKSTLDVNNTYSAINALTSPEASQILSEITYLPSVRRDAIAQGSTDPYMTIFLDASLISKGWLDVNSAKSNTIFTNLVESITSGRTSVENGLRTAHDELNISLQNQ